MKLFSQIILLILFLIGLNLFFDLFTGFNISNLIVSIIRFFISDIPVFSNLRMINRKTLAIYRQMDELYSLEDNDKLLDLEIKISSDGCTRDKIRNIDFLQYTGDKNDSFSLRGDNNPYVRFRGLLDYNYNFSLLEDCTSNIDTLTLYNPKTEKDYKIETNKDKMKLLYAFLMYFGSIKIKEYNEKKVLNNDELSSRRMEIRKKHLDKLAKDFSEYFNTELEYNDIQSLYSKESDEKVFNELLEEISSYRKQEDYLNNLTDDFLGKDNGIPIIDKVSLDESLSILSLKIKSTKGGTDGSFEVYANKKDSKELIYKENFHEIWEESLYLPPLIDASEVLSYKVKVYIGIYFTSFTLEI